VANREGPNFCDFFEIKDRVENLDSSWEQQKEKAKKDFEQLFGTP